MSNVEKTLEERGSRYGEFAKHATISQELKDIVYKYLDPEKNENIHAEALDMIMHKVARILNGDPNYIDSWHDIAGYATLVVKHLTKEK